jgi:uncharacterized protein GlcG (DUF336 family)
MGDTFQKASITTELAHRMIQAAETKANEMGIPFVIAVADESGVLKAFSRMDGAPLLSVQVAQDKAYTAVGFGLPTDGWYDFIKDDPPLAVGATAGIDRLVPHAHPSRSDVIRRAVELYLYGLACERDAEAYDARPLTDAELALADDPSGWEATPEW